MCIITKYLSNNIANITKDIWSNYTYVEDPPGRNKSNRLLKVERYNSKYFDLSGEYSYDPDGNFSSLTRSYNSNNFSYHYYTGTNRLKKVSGSTDQYTYDYNGNQTNDYLNNNTNIKYDHRNLITEFTKQDLAQDPPITVAGYLYFVLRYDNLRYASGDIHLDHHSNDDRILYEAALDVFNNFPQPNEYLQARMFGMGVFGLHQDTNDCNLELFKNRVKVPFS